MTEWLESLYLRWNILTADRYGNTVLDLAVFCCALLGVFLIIHYRKQHKFRHLRRQIPVSIGGWGTRGKSGVERLKAAFLNGMGLSVLSKTTGCEAVMLYGDRGGDLLELPILRPNNKATIWEQLEVANIGSQSGCDVFLWECMGLRPEYVKILQEKWMRDDIATITNTWPDHEDLQGPTGYDVATTMTEFIPPESTLLTTETQMTPVLAESCRLKKTEMRHTSQIAQNAIDSSITRLFPYEEHPSNIALTLAVAEEFGMNKHLALWEMANRVVTDIGVLRKYSPVEFDEGRKVHFINGFSANEKHACLKSWEKMGMDQYHSSFNPKTMNGILVNNRDDRPARSRVFARLLCAGIEADIIWVTGSGIDAFKKSLESACSHRMTRAEQNKFLGKIRTIASHHSGEQIMAAMAGQLPAQTEIHVMGVQNIKGPGLNVLKFLESGGKPTTETPVAKEAHRLFEFFANAIRDFRSPGTEKERRRAYQNIVQDFVNGKVDEHKTRQRLLDL